MQRNNSNLYKNNGYRPQSLDIKMYNCKWLHIWLNNIVNRNHSTSNKQTNKQNRNRSTDIFWSEIHLSSINHSIRYIRSIKSNTRTLSNLMKRPGSSQIEKGNLVCHISNNMMKLHEFIGILSFYAKW